jgi:hypothetical protein
MSELRERLREAADAAAREGRTPPAAALVRRGRRRRLRLVAGTVAVVALVLGAVTVATDWLAAPPLPLAPPATAATPSTVSAPDVSISPDPGRVEPRAGVGQPPGRVGHQMVQDVASELTRCRGGDPHAPKVLVAWGAAHGQTWLILAKPPLPGESWLCWAQGLFDAGGGGGLGNEGGRDLPLTPIRASGSQNIRSDGHYWGQVIGTVPKEATRVRVLFHQGIAPLDLKPIQSGDQFPRNFFVGFYRQPQEDKHLQWFVAKVVAYDRSGHQIAECGDGSASSC